MLDRLGIYTWGEFAEYLGCVLVVATVVLPIAAVIYFGGNHLWKFIRKSLDTAYGCMVELKHNNNKRKKGK